MILRDEEASLPYPAPTDEAPIPKPITSTPTDKTMRAAVIGVMDPESSDGVCEESQDGPTRGVGDLGLTRAIDIAPINDEDALMRDLFDARYADRSEAEREVKWKAMEPDIRNGWRRMTRRAAALGARIPQRLGLERTGEESPG